ncbi:hypothetical protein ABF87_08565 [Nitrosomonas sp. JL21]|uniref:hypothetical protein n=1 Tax=Nitrosomonas sp. JL21 TaxID=153949 RepID=UPI00137198EC|nr:hypothetical protein [Nitrosomonas sp. JL21]MBL8498821.1 hypothetical protein [Nitrosomonas sp.]MCC7092255.1 hypothetical protein [Nitrosomonas sp.]MXS78011.1 hypothetical protein [Nitrosomonas sp. JL21]
MDDLVFARLLHVLGVVLWIGGVSMVTSVLLPTLMRMQSMSEAMAFFQQFRRRFAAQARITTLVVGISGFYMVYELNAWQRFLQWQYWWMHAMVAIWLLFSVMLFIQEPRSRRHQTPQSAAVPISPDTFTRIQRKHLFLLILSLITIAGAVAGSHGWLVGM